MTVKECFDVIGGNYEDIMGRLMTEERVKKFLLMFLKDDSFENLCSAMSVKDYETAFRAAHTLKGTCLNLGLERLKDSSDAITEALRNNNDCSLAEVLLAQVIEDYNVTINGIKQLN